MAGPEPTPAGRQLLVEGQLSGSVDGRPITVTADAAGVCLTVDSVGSAWRLRQQLPALAGVLAVLRHGQVPLRLRIGSLGELAVLPVPHWALRLLGLR